MTTQNESTTQPRRVLVIRDGSHWDDDVPGLLAACGYTVIGPIDEVDRSIVAVTEDLTLVPDVVVIQANQPGPCNWYLPRFFWETHRVPSVVITDSSVLTEHLPLAAKSGVYATLRHPLREEDLHLAIPMVWTHHKITIDLESKVERLESTVAARRVVEQAKWRLVETKGLTEPEAHAHLQREARARRLRISEVASEFLETIAADAAR